MILTTAFSKDTVYVKSKRLKTSAECQLADVFPGPAMGSGSYRHISAVEGDIPIYCARQNIWFNPTAKNSYTVVVALKHEKAVRLYVHRHPKAKMR